MHNGSEYVTLSVPSDPRYLRIVRDFLTSVLNELGFNALDRMGIVLAVNEAYANVIQHCYRGDTTQRVDLTLLIVPQLLTIEMRDYGGKIDLSCIEARDLDDVRPGGVGTYLMRAIMDEVTYDVSSDTGTVLRMSKRRSQLCKST
jgi:anti-sigma regulatory factor (Ser/Thr protein kinase)